MNMTAAERELRTFRAFAERGPLKIVPESIQSMPPPAPDIRCYLVSGERIAFELVELIDEGYARDLNTLYGTMRLLHELPERLPQELRKSLEERLRGNAYISFDFANGLPLRDREAAAVDALRWLVERGEPIEGRNEVEGPLRARMRAVQVNPWRWELHFDSSSYLRIADPTLDRLRDKFPRALGARRSSRSFKRTSLHRRSGACGCSRRAKAETPRQIFCTSVTTRRAFSLACDLSCSQPQISVQRP